MYKILFLTDFSQHSYQARLFLKNFAQCSKSEVFIFHALTPVVGAITQMGSTVELSSVLYKGAEEELYQIQNEFIEKQIETHIILHSGSLQNEIEKFLHENTFDMIVMGTHGKSNLLDRILGSNATYVLTHLSLPTIVIPSKYQPRTIRNVVFAHQLFTPKINHLEKAFEFLEYWGINRLDILHIYSEEMEVYHPNMEIVNVLKEKFSHKDLQFHFVQDDSVVYGLYKYMHENEVDFLITSSNKKTFWRRLVSGNISSKMATEFETPILVLKDPTGNDEVY